MTSFHPSRGRILFEVFCALAISASCAGAWVQTGASAFLPAAVVAALYGLWHLTDLAGRKPAVALETGDAQLAAEGQGDLIDYLETVEPLPVAEPAPIAVAEAVEPAPTAPPRPKRKSRKKPAAAAEKSATPIIELQIEDFTPPAGEPLAAVEEHHAPIAPLFEPQPLVRQQRAIFGRKSG